MKQDTDKLFNIIERLYETEWSDGLPIMPPTKHQVQKFAQYVDRPLDDVIATIPPLQGKGTIEKIAANAIMAGCLPEYMPVVIAALEAMEDPGLNARGMLCSMHSAVPLLIINGPIRGALGINSGPNVFGQGWRANATIGRAVNLALMNIGGARPGGVDKSVLGQPGNYTFCIAENEEENPWNPLHVDRGLSATDSAITVIGAEPPQLASIFMPGNPFDMLTVLVSYMTHLGAANTYFQGQSTVILAPEFAAICAKAGWKKTDVQQFLFEKARLPHSILKKVGSRGPDTSRYSIWPRWIDKRNEDEMIPMARRPGDILVVVAGSLGSACAAYLPGWGTSSVTRKIAA